MKKSLIIAFGGAPKRQDDEGEDLVKQEKEAAGKAFAAAIKGGDGLEIAEAYEALMLACMGSGVKKSAHEYPESEDEGEAESDEGDEY